MIKDNEIHVAIAFDQNYLTPFYVLLTSIFLNNKSNSIVFHTITTGISAAEKELLSSYVKKCGGEITFYNLDQNSVANFIVPQGLHFTLAIYYRLFFPFLIPSTVKRLIYIDTDVIVIGNLLELFQLDIGVKPAAAAIDTGESVRSDLGFTNPGAYFNSGVLLMNIPEWKKQQITEKAIDFIQNNSEKLKWPDQDALNVVMMDNFYKLDSRFNLTFADIPKSLPKRQYTSFLKDVVIIHYTKGYHKPWHMIGKNRLRYVYHHYLKKSPKSFEKRYSDFAFTKNKLYNFCKIRLDETLLDYPHIHKAFKKLKVI